MKSVLPLACAALFCSSLPPAFAATLTVSVAGTSGPWSEATNPSLPYGTSSNGALAPTVVTSPSGDLLAGSAYQFSYVSGFTQTNAGYGQVDANGYTSIMAGGSYPSRYATLPPGQDAFLEELMGAFADSAGKVVGTPFVIGNGGSFVAPVGASAILLGINDDNYNDNSGALAISVSGANLSPVPLPRAAPMFGAALAMLGLMGYGVRRRAAAATKA